MSSEQHNCEWIDEHIDAYLDEDLGEFERAAFERHVDGCAGCKDELTLARSVLSELRAMPEASCPQWVVDRAEQLAGADEPGWRERIREWIDSRSAIMLRPAMVTMMFIVIAVGAFVLTQHDAAMRDMAMNDSQEEARIASEQALLAFAYVGKYTSRSASILRHEVMQERVMPAVGRAMMETGSEVNSMLIKQVLSPPSTDGSS